MARMARVVVAGAPHHVTQRGNRRQTTFFAPQDYLTYLRIAAEEFRAAEVEIWAYCLMPNHVHATRNYGDSLIINSSPIHGSSRVAVTVYQISRASYPTGMARLVLRRSDYDSLTGCVWRGGSSHLRG